MNYLNRAECYIAVGKYQEAQNDLSEAQKLDPKSSDLYLLKARMAQMQFRYDDAYGYAMEAVKLGCDKSQALPYLKKRTGKTLLLCRILINFAMYGTY